MKQKHGRPRLTTVGLSPYTDTASQKPTRCSRGRLHENRTRPVNAHPAGFSSPPARRKNPHFCSRFCLTNPAGTGKIKVVHAGIAQLVE